MNARALAKLILCSSLTILLMFLLAMPVSSRAADDKDLEAQAKAFIAEAEKTLIPLEIEQGKAWWVANTTGTDEAYEKASRIRDELNNRKKS